MSTDPEVRRKVLEDVRSQLAGRYDVECATDFDGATESFKGTDLATGKLVLVKTACDAVGGKFHENLFGWMLRANVFLGDDLGTIFGHDH